MRRRLIVFTVIVGGLLFAYSQVGQKASNNVSNSQSLKVEKVMPQEIQEKDFQKTSSSKPIIDTNNDLKSNEETYAKASMMRDDAVFVNLDKGDSSLLISYLENNGNPNIKNSEGMTLLSASAMNGDLKAVDYLIKSGADINAQDDNGSTPLMTAIMSSTAEGEYADIIDTFIDSGADLNLADNAGMNVVHMAIEIHSPEVLNKLFAAGAKQTALPDGSTTVHMSAINDCAKCIPVLVKNGAKVDQKDPQGNTALGTASSNGNFSSTRILVAMGASETIKNNEGKTPRDLALESDSEITKAFLSDER